MVSFWYELFEAIVYCIIVVRSGGVYKIGFVGGKCFSKNVAETVLSCEIVQQHAKLQIQT